MKDETKRYLIVVLILIGLLATLLVLVPMLKEEIEVSFPDPSYDASCKYGAADMNGTPQVGAITHQMVGNSIKLHITRRVGGNHIARDDI
jgi:hypothetical protein